MASRWGAAESSWYSHPVYAQYWRHYYHAMAWMHSHWNAYRKSRDFYFSFPWFCPYAALPWSSHAYEVFQAQHMAWQEWPYISLHRESSQQRLRDCSGTQAATREEGEPCEEEEQESKSDNEIECDLSYMEITEELRQFFAKTERHREERRRQQQLDAEHLGGYVNADHDLYYSCHPSVEPPSQRPGAQRQVEMKRLYGNSAPKILAMEASIQLSFDKKYDRKKPKYWPVIPLKF